MDDAGRVKRIVLLVATVASFLTPFMGSAMNVAIPWIGADLRMSPLERHWVVTAYLLSTAACLLPFGRAADLFGRKKVFLFGIAVYTATSLLCGLVRTGGELIAIRTIQGVGAAMVFGTGIAIVSSVFAPGERGRAIGWTTSAVYAGLSVGPPVGGFLTHYLGWRWVFFVNSAVGLAVIAVVFLGLKGEWRDSRARRYDLSGALGYGLGVCASLYGLAAAGSSRYAVGVLVGGAVVLALFVAREWTCSDPLLDLGLFRNVTFAFSNLAALIHYSSTFAVGYLLPFYLKEVKGHSPQTAGLVLLSQPVVMAIVSPLAGRLSDRFEPRIIASLGMAVTLAGLVGFAFLDADTSTSRVVLNLVGIGLGFGLFSSPNTNAIMTSVEKARYGVASSAVGTMRMVGQASSMAIVGSVSALFLRNGEAAGAEDVPALLESLRVAFALFSVLCGIGIAASLARGRLRGAVGPAKEASRNA